MTRKDKDYTKRVRNILRALEILNNEISTILKESAEPVEKKIDKIKSVCERLNNLIEIIKNIDKVGYAIAKQCECKEKDFTTLTDCVKNSIQILKEYFKEEDTGNIPNYLAILT